MGKEKPTTKQCKFCKSEIDIKATVCPVCKRGQKKGHGCLLTILIFIVIVGGGIAATINMGNSIQQSVSGVKNDSEYITLEEYNKIETGMTYEQVAEIVGSSGTVSSQVESNGYKIVIITWYGNGVAGSNANVTFTNNAVTGKAQVGLK